MESTHEESHGLGAGHSTLSSLTQMLLNRLSLSMIVSGHVIIFEYLVWLFCIFSMRGFCYLISSNPYHYAGCGAYKIHLCQLRLTGEYSQASLGGPRMGHSR
jgi:hypothetical protein